MKIRIMRKCNCSKDYDCGGFDYFTLISKLFKFRWFNDNGFKFLYINLGKKQWRFGG